MQFFTFRIRYNNIPLSDVNQDEDLFFKWPDKSTTGYDMLDFKLYKKFVMDISAN